MAGLAPARPSVVYVAPDKMGGALSIVANLLACHRTDSFDYRLVLTHNRLDRDLRSTLRPGAFARTSVEHTLPLESVTSVLRRLHRAVGRGPGVIVCNDRLELLLAASRRVDQAVVQILHGDYDYYYDLATQHEPYVHAFVAYSRTVYEQLLARLPARSDSIFCLPYGIPLTTICRSPQPGPLRLLFVGRLDPAKGVFDLPEIDRGLRASGVDVRWSIVGDGPVGDVLKQRWQPGDSVRWITRATPDEVLAICGQHDLLVLPSRAEGLSVATVEAMSAGVVPVVTDLPSMRELVDDRMTGLRAPIGDVARFVEAITHLAGDRMRLESMSRAARALVRSRFDITVNAAAYDDLFARWQELRRRAVPPPRAIGSRLDQPWIPNVVVRMVRRLTRRDLHAALVNR